MVADMAAPNVAGEPRDESTDRAAFGELVREALDQLHDRTFLQKHPLRALLGDTTGDRRAVSLAAAAGARAGYVIGGELARGVLPVVAHAVVAGS